MQKRANWAGGKHDWIHTEICTISGYQSFSLKLIKECFPRTRHPPRPYDMVSAEMIGARMCALITHVTGERSELPSVIIPDACGGGAGIWQRLRRRGIFVGEVSTSAVGMRRRQGGAAPTHSHRGSSSAFRRSKGVAFNCGLYKTRLHHRVIRISSF